MDYTSWSRYEAVPLSNGIIARRTGLRYMKSPEEISAYYLERFGRYWFDELPKTDNTYCQTSKYYGCTLAPGVPLIPNLCRRPLRSPSSGGFDYTFSSFSNSDSYSSPETYSNNLHNSWIEKNNVINKKYDNGTNNNNHIEPTTILPRKLGFRTEALDSDSDTEDSYWEHSQNTVTWLSWIIITITTIVTAVKDTIVGRQEHENHVNTRVPLKQHGGVSWYQYPVLWLYKLALLVHHADVWLLSKVHSVLQVDSWGSAEQRRKWALILLLIPPILYAGFLLVQWLLEEDSTPKSDFLFAWMFSPFLAAAGFVSSCVSDLLGWFDGTWFWAPWVALSDWITQAAEDVPIIESSDPVPQTDLKGFLLWPLESVTALFTSLGELIGSTASTFGEGAVTAYSSIGTFLFAMYNWLINLLTEVPALLSSALAMVLYPFSLISWSSTSSDYSPLTSTDTTMPTAEHYSAIAAAPDSHSLELLLRDKHLLTILIRNLLSSDEFDRVMAERQSSNQQLVNSAVDFALNAALSRINLEFKQVKEELNDKTSSGKYSVEAKIDALKQQIEEYQMALSAHKTLVSEQAALSSELEARVISAEQHKLQEIEEQAKLKEQILLEVATVKAEIVGQLLNGQLNQKVVADSGNFTPTPPTLELEAFINSTVERLLAIYDADKIAKVDYALASSGGSVLNVRCTETFSKKNAQYQLWGYPLWSKAGNDPRIALEPAMYPGECWAFTGNRGYLVIELSENITVTAFTMEHLPRSLSPTGTIDTAPRDFHVLGLETENDDTPILLGRFRYDDNGVSLQHFQALEVDHTFKIVELAIESNHGNLEYTCLYRFRVHGKPKRLS